MDAIVAVYSDWGIGARGTQPVVLKADRKLFKTLTDGATVIVGRKTMEDFPNGKPLKNRRNIVVSRRDIEIEGAESRMDMIYMVADQEGISRKTMIRLFYSGRKDGIWGLVDQRKVRSVTRDNVGYRIFLAYCDRTIGGFDSNAHRALLTDLRSGKVFPEFGTWRDLYKAEHPYERVPDTCPPGWIPRATWAATSTTSAGCRTGGSSS